MREDGVMGIGYRQQRIEGSVRYRLLRRTDEVRKYIQMYSTGNTILDVGTADGLMLTFLRNPRLMFFGIDLSLDLLKSGGDRGLKLVQADAGHLPIGGERVDVIIATAVLEHLCNPEESVREFSRVLRGKGIVIATSPNPFFDVIASKIGYIEGEKHVKRFNLGGLKSLFESAGYVILEARSFMPSPFFGIPFEKNIEDILNKVGLGFIMTNQVVVCEKPVKEGYAGVKCTPLDG